MRKSLSIVALLVFSSIAIARPSNTFLLTDSSSNREITLTSSDPITLLVWSNYYPTSFDLKIEPQGSCILGQPIITATGRTPENDDVKLIETNWEFSSSADSGYLETGIASPLATVDFHSDVPGDITLNLYFYNSTDWIGYNCVGMTIHEIPEPMTLVFLGIGGLMLRRRK
jgi:hypothetical protein